MTKQVSGWLIVGVISCLLMLGGLMRSGMAQAQAVSDNQRMFDLLNRIGQLEQEVRQLRGDLEVYRYRQEDLGQRLEALESGSGAAAARPREPRGTAPPPERAMVSPTPPLDGRMPPTAPSQPSSAPPAYRSTPPSAAQGSEKVAYDTALNLLRDGRFDESIANFQEFLRQNPDSSLAGNAQYWLGEAYYVSRDFDNAKEAFINLGVSYPNNDKIPDALLKLGVIYQEQGDKTKAREALQKLVQTYPNTQAAGQAQKRLQTLR